MKFIDQVRTYLNAQISRLKAKKDNFKVKRYYFFLVLVPITLGFSLAFFQNCRPSRGIGTTAGNSSNGTLVPPPVCQTTADVSWMAPTTNADGSPLTDLAQYKIYYGVISGLYTSWVTVSDPNVLTYQITNMPTGIYYFAMTAINAAGTESAYSAEVAINLATCGASGNIGFGGATKKVAQYKYQVR